MEKSTLLYHLAITCLVTTICTQGNTLEGLKKSLAKKEDLKKDTKTCDPDAVFEKCKVESGLVYPKKLAEQQRLVGNNEKGNHLLHCKLVKINTEDALMKFGACWVKDCSAAIDFDGHCEDDSKDGEPKCNYDEVFWKCEQEVGLKYPDVAKYNWVAEDAHKKFECEIMAMNKKDVLDDFGACWVRVCPEDANKPKPNCDKYAEKNVGRKSVLLQKPKESVD